MINLISKNAYYPEGQMPPPEHRPSDAVCLTGKPTGPNLTNAEVESREFRCKLDRDEGYICVRVAPGEALGEVYVNVQYEGPVDTGRGEPNLCMKGQNDTLLRVSAFLKELFGPAAGTWNISIDAQPCPKATQPPHLREAERTLTGKVIHETRDRPQGPKDERKQER